MSNYDEQERLKRLRERQLSARDPHVKQRQREQIYVQRAKKSAGRKMTAGEMWTAIPHTIKWPLYGLVVGLVVFFSLPFFWNSNWALIVSLGIVFFLVMIGFLIGRGIQTREDLKDLIRR